MVNVGAVSRDRTSRRIDRVDAFIRKRFVVLAALVLVIAAGVRFVNINADPPGWMSPDYLTDEGWWADPARGKLYFNNFFSDDFGTALLMTPVYTGILQTVYSVFGVGTGQTRAVAAVAGLLSVAAVGFFLLRRFGKMASLAGSLLLSLCPLAWAFSRVGLVEWTQTLFITLSFVTWMSWRKSYTSAFVTGALLSIAVWVKPNAILLGALPVACAAVVEMIIGFREGFERSGKHSAFRFVFAAVGFVIGCEIVMFAVLLPHWSDFVALAASESHAGDASVWSYLTIPGTAFMSTLTFGADRVPTVWQPALWAPAIFLLVWGYLLWIGSRRSSPSGVAFVEMPVGAVEAGALAWFVATLFFVSTELLQPPRRLVLLLPSMAICAAIFLHRYLLRSGIAITPPGSKRAGERGSESEPGGGAKGEDTRVGRRRVCDTPQADVSACGRPGYWITYLRWAVLLAPIWIASKAALTRLIMHESSGLQVGNHPGLSYEAAGTVVMAALAVMVALVAFVRRPALRLSVLAARVSPLLAIVAFFAVSIPAVATGTFAPSKTFENTQRQLSKYVTADSGEVVMGHVATSFFMPYPVRTVRRALPQDESPPPNPGIWEKTHPEYIIQLSRFNYRSFPLRYEDLIKAHGYSLERTFELGPFRGTNPRYVVGLYKWTGVSAAAPSATAAQTAEGPQS